MQVIIAVYIGNRAGVVKLRCGFDDDACICIRIVSILICILDTIGMLHLIKPVIVRRKSADPCFPLCVSHDG